MQFWKRRLLFQLGPKYWPKRGAMDWYFLLHCAGRWTKMLLPVKFWTVNLPSLISFLSEQFNGIVHPSENPNGY